MWSNEMKKRHSEIMKEVWRDRSNNYYKEHTHYISKPCEHFKSIMKEEGYEFISEHRPLFPDRHFRIDISFPDKKIGIEINGTQHYENKQLKPYYQERHNLICESGWVLYEIPYNLAWNRDFVFNFLKNIEKNTGTDYSGYLKESLKYKCKKCGADRDRGSNSGLCHKCFHEARRKVERPSYEQLLEDKKTLPMTTIGKKYGVCDNAVRKWLTAYEKHLTKK